MVTNVSSGQTSSGTVSSGTANAWVVLSGGTTSGLTISSGGTETVNLGGVAISTLDSGTMSDSGIDRNTTVVAGGRETVLVGGVASNTVLSGGSQTVNSGGTASGTTISSGGVLNDAGTDVNTTVFAGKETILAGGTASNTTVLNTASQSVNSGGSTTGTILAGGTETVIAGGSASGTVISSGGVLSNSGIDLGTIVSNGGKEAVASGGVASSTTVLNGGSQTIASGGTGINITVSSGGLETVSAGGVTTGTMVSGGPGSAAVNVQGTAISMTVTSGAHDTVFVGGVASDTQVLGGGHETVSSGGLASGTHIYSGGAEWISAGGAVTNLYVSSGGVVDLITVAYSAGEGATLGANDVLTVTSGGNTVSSLQLAGDYTGEYFYVASDLSSSGGTDITVGGPSSIAGVTSGSQTVTDATTLRPLSSVIIGDTNRGQTETVTVALSTAANGTLSNLGGGSYAASTGTYTVSGTAASVTTALQGLVFTPTAHQVAPGNTVTTTFTVTDTNTGGAIVTNANTTVITTAQDTAPTISGLPPTESGLDTSTTTPFGGVAVTDPDTGAATSANITLTSGGVASDADGLLSGGGLTKTGTGTYSLAATTPASLAAELNALTFTPTAHQVAPGSSVATAFGLTVAEGSATTSASTTLTTTAQNTAPTISGLPPNETGPDNSAMTPFGGVAVTDPDTGAATSAAITLTSGGTATDADGILTGSGLTKTGTGTYALSATTPGGLSSELEALSFTPTLQHSTSSQVDTVFNLLVSEGAAATPGSTTVTVDGTPCYCRGTLILTDTGEVAVEDLRIGDRLITKAGEAKPIHWIGRRSYNGRFIAGNRDLLPVLIKQGALSDDVPRRDLLVSPLHAMFLDGVLIPALALVNEVSIVQAETIETVEYIHLELEAHDVIYAEGALSETFVDDDSRGMFHNVAEHRALYPRSVRTPARYCAPRVEDGEELEDVWRRIAARTRPLVAEKTPAPAARLQSNLEIVQRGRFEGWAHDEGSPDAPVLLRVLDNGVAIGQVLANTHRKDLEQAGIGAGNRSFAMVVPGGLSPDRRHVIQVQRMSDGRDLRGSPWVLEAAVEPLRHAG